LPHTPAIRVDLDPVDMPLRISSDATGRVASTLALTLALAACSESRAERLPVDGGSDAGDVDVDTPNFTLRFRAMAGDALAKCGEAYAAFGESGTDVAELLDLRFYVHDVALKNADGAFVPMAIVDEAPWQSSGVALLDFEDATGACANGTEATRHFITGVLPEGEYTGVRFTVGVPFDLNHLDVTLAPSPLNLTRLYWNWRGGYVFLRVDLQTVPEGEALPAGFHVHLGSTGCTSDAANVAPEEECMNPNRPTITLEEFDPAHDVVVLDVAAMLEGVDLSFNTEGSALGCMSAPTDPECLVPMTRLGLPFGEAEPAMRAFRVEAE
jgi:uncharacterized repeat protein (TIGR04052 family)